MDDLVRIAVNNGVELSLCDPAENKVYTATLDASQALTLSDALREAAKASPSLKVVDLSL